MEMVSSSGASRKGTSRFVLTKAETVMFITIVIIYRGNVRMENRDSPVKTFPTSIGSVSMYGYSTKVCNGQHILPGERIETAEIRRLWQFD